MSEKIFSVKNKNPVQSVNSELECVKQLLQLLIFGQRKVSELTPAAAADITIPPGDDLIRIAIRTAIHYAALH